MSGTFDRAARYCLRAEECLRAIAPSQTPGSREPLRLIANYYLLLAELEKWKMAGQPNNLGSNRPHGGYSDEAAN
jgi:hypothetical protein